MRFIRAVLAAAVSSLPFACASVETLEGTSFPPGCSQVTVDPHARLILERTPCFGSCPMFAVEVHPDGNVLYTGRGYVRVHGSQRWTIEPSTAAELFARAACSHPETWQPTYGWSVTDMSAADVTADPADYPFRRRRRFATWRTTSMRPVASRRMSSATTRGTSWRGVATTCARDRGRVRLQDLATPVTHP